MFGLYFGHYLLENNHITKAEADSIVGLHYPACLDTLVEAGAFTKEEGAAYFAQYLTEAELTSEDVGVIDSGNLTRILSVFLHFDEEGAIEANLAAYQKEHHLSDEEMETLREEGDIVRLFPEYVNRDPAYYNRFVKITLESISRFVSDRVIIKKAHQARDYDFHCMACQELKGSHHIFLGIAGEEGNLLAVVNRFTGKGYDTLHDKAYDSICEFINTVNGMYASELSKENVYFNIVPPYYHTGGVIGTNGLVYSLPLVIDGAEVDVLFSFDTVLTITETD